MEIEKRDLNLQWLVLNYLELSHVQLKQYVIFLFCFLVLMGSWVCLVFSSTFGGFLFITFHVANMASQKRLNLNVHKSFWNLEELFTQVIYENLLSNFAVLGDKIRRRLKRATQCFGEVFYYLDGGLIFSIFLQQLWRNFDLGK